IGGTGSAKSSLVNLIPRLYDVNDGAVIVGGHDVRDYKLKNLRDAVAVVLQKNELFSGTIMENLKWGNADATDEEVYTAAQMAQAHDFIMSFPDGYQTMLGQGGVNVSGGQKQRICIARALLKNPKILILDDSTSAVDTATDAKIRSAFATQMPGITKIIIAQRIGSVMESDKIVVLDDGKIVAVGKHAELMESCQIYREVYYSQNKGEEKDASNS
ncbi:MAG: ABC transporter ATP-binding protein, partial [Clostridia bacterium]|nr:ABC transporter ATP-binding protein [Clostridia bacterium]